MNIVFSSDDNYARHLAASMVSIFENNKEEPRINIYILNVGLSESNIQKLTDTVHKYNREIFIVDFSDVKSRFPTDNIHLATFTIETYTRMFLPDALPETEHRAMWIDGDTSVLGNIHDMYFCDMEGCPMAAVVDQPSFGLEISKKDAGYTDGPYFAAGMFVADLDMWREEHISEKLIDYYAEREGNMMFLDMALMNHVMQGRIHKLPFKYHVITPAFFLSYKKMVSKWGEPFYSKQEYKEGKSHPVIVHYANFRPWKRWCLHPMKKHYRKYIKMTPYKDIPLENDGLLKTISGLSVSVTAKIKNIFK